MYPRARQHGLLVDRVGEETIIFDQDRKEAHRGDAAAAIAEILAIGPSVHSHAP